MEDVKIIRYNGVVKKILSIEKLFRYLSNEDKLNMMIFDCELLSDSKKIIYMSPKLVYDYCTTDLSITKIYNNHFNTRYQTNRLEKECKLIDNYLNLYDAIHNKDYDSYDMKLFPMRNKTNHEKVRNFKRKYKNGLIDIISESHSNIYKQMTIIIENTELDSYKLKI